MSGFQNDSYVTFTNSDPNTTAGDGIYKAPGSTGAYFNVYGPTNEVFDYISISANADPNSDFTVTVTGATLSLNGVALGTSYTAPVGDAATTLNQLVFTPDDGTTSGATVQISVPGAGTVVGATESFYVYCFLAGTRIRCLDGERPVESLHAGDLVITATGAAKAIRFVGRREIDTARHPEHAPVCLPAGCLAPSVPRRDLLVSPDHAIAIDGILIPARALIGGPIRQCAGAVVQYFHLQLDNHTLVWAEGAPCETLLNDDDLPGFDNAADAPPLRHFSTPCLPRLSQGPRVEAIRARLWRRGMPRRAA